MTPPSYVFCSVIHSPTKVEVSVPLLFGITVPLWRDMHATSFSEKMHWFVSSIMRNNLCEYELNE